MRNGIYFCCITGAAISSCYCVLGCAGEFSSCSILAKCLIPADAVKSPICVVITVPKISPSQSRRFQIFLNILPYLEKRDY
jgi:hypothetical protein